VLLVCRATSAQDKLTGVDHALLVTSGLLIAADWLQTVDLVRRGYPEHNPILGQHPSLGTVNTLVGATLAADLLVSRIQEKNLRRFLWLTVIVVEGRTVVRNHRAGLRFNWRF
jgi:hypothetical protein